MLKKMSARMADMAGRAMANRRKSGDAAPAANAGKSAAASRATRMADMAGRAMANRRQSGAAAPDMDAGKAVAVSRAARGLLGRGRKSGAATAESGGPGMSGAIARAARGARGASGRAMMAKGGEAKKDGKMPAFLMEKFKKGDMADKTGRAVKRKTADVKGRAMKKGA